ncbi:hypothetical protein ACFYPC_33725 [Streptomyces sp. NPDC005808]|uniref:hypothetical protein n=1 Tax=Streptomyces sp. NPDC005808 TaxID=3364734 RepID=UPI0036BDA36C
MGRDRANKPRRPRDLGQVPEGHVEAVPGVMVTLTGPPTATAAAAHDRMANGPKALADYVRTGTQWQVTVMGGVPRSVRTHG